MRSAAGGEDAGRAEPGYRGHVDIIRGGNGRHVPSKRKLPMVVDSTKKSVRWRRWRVYENRE